MEIGQSLTSQASAVERAIQLIISRGSGDPTLARFSYVWNRLRAQSFTKASQIYAPLLGYQTFVE